jgi:hypothetical protein
MSCKNTSKKTKNTSSFNLNSISGVLNIILGVFTTTEQPLTPLPPPLILAGAKLRTGISAKELASNVISRGSEANGAVGDVFADGPNVDEAKELIRAEELVDMLLTKSVVNVVIPPGISVTTVGVGNLGAPVLAQGVTTNMGVGQGILS